MGKPLVTILVFASASAALVGLAQDEPTQLEGNVTLDEEGSGIPFLSDLLQSAGAVGQFIDLVLGVMTFNVPGAPWWIRVPMSTVLIGGLTYIVLALIRGGA